MDTSQQKQIDDIIAILKENIDPTSIFLFGSLASGKTDKESDIDLLVVAPSSERPSERRLKLKKLLLKYDREIGLDLLVYTPDEFNMFNKEPSSFVYSVAKHGLKIYDRKNP